MNCDCDACAALAREHEGDPELLALYQRKLLIRGWAGRKTPTEKAYMLAHADWAREAAERGAATLTRWRSHVSIGNEQTAPLAR